MSQQINTREEEPTYHYWLAEVVLHRGTLETGQADPEAAPLIPEVDGRKQHHASCRVSPGPKEP